MQYPFENKKIQQINERTILRLMCSWDLAKLQIQERLFLNKEIHHWSKHGFLDSFLVKSYIEDMWLARVNYDLSKS